MKRYNIGLSAIGVCNPSAVTYESAMGDLVRYEDHVAERDGVVVRGLAFCVAAHAAGRAAVLAELAPLLRVVVAYLVAMGPCDEADDDDTGYCGIEECGYCAIARAADTWRTDHPEDVRRVEEPAP